MEPIRNQPCPCGSGKRYKACCGRITDGRPYAERIALAARLFGSGEAAAARKLLLAAQQERPDDPECALALSMVAMHENDVTAATRWLQRTLELTPDDVELQNNLGVMLSDLGATAQAAAAFRRVLALAPDLADTWGNLGNVLKAQGELTAAIEHYRRLLALRPEDHNAWSSIGNVLLSQGEPEAACDAYRQSLQIKPDNPVTLSNLLLAINYRSDLSWHDILQQHQAYNRCVQHALTAPPRPNTRGRRLRIGYVSADFHSHAAFNFIEPILLAHDRRQFEIHAFANLSIGDAKTAWAQKQVEHWHNIANLSGGDAVAAIRAGGIDILVDLSGHTGANRLPVFAQKAAPIQISWLGYGNTTGLSEMDYLLTDPVSSPVDTPQLFSEQLLRLPISRLCYAPPATSPAVAPPPALRNGYITFGCFNNPAKLNPQVLQLWSTLLQQLPTARLLLKPFSSDSERALWRNKLQAVGIDPQRVELRAKSDYPRMLEEYGDVDIVLDPFPFNGGATTCEALWCGLPVVNLRGDSMLARQGACLLNAAGLERWITTTPADYLRLALELAGDLPALAAQRQQQREQIRRSALCDATGFTRALEALYRQLLPA